MATAGRNGGKPLRRNRPYLDELDLLRGLAIVAVVAIHATVPLMGRAGVDSWHRLAGMLVNQMGRFSVPAFLFISGLLLTYPRRSPEPRSPTPAAGTWRQMLRRRAAGIVLPYLVWSVAGQLAAGAPTGLGRPALDSWLPALLLGRNHFYQLYFVPLVFQLYLLAPLLGAALGSGHSSRRLPTVLGAAVALQLAVVTGYELVFRGWLSLPAGWGPWTRTMVRTTLPAWAAYVAAGMAAGLRYPEFSAWLARISNRRLVAAWAAALGLLLYDYWTSVPVTGTALSPSDDFMRPAVLPYAAISIVGLLRCARHGPVLRPARQAISWLGRYSFGIYLVHLAVLERFGAAAGPGLLRTWYGATLLTAAVLAASLAIAWLAGRLPLGWLVAGHPTTRRRPGTSNGYPNGPRAPVTASPA